MSEVSRRKGSMATSSLIKGREKMCIRDRYKCAYDKTTKELVSSALHVGDLNGGSGYVDAPGSSARFNRPRQGVFVKNPEYVAQGKTDVYDFYLCDHNNKDVYKRQASHSPSPHRANRLQVIFSLFWCRL